MQDDVTQDQLTPTESERLRLVAAIQCEVGALRSRHTIAYRSWMSADTDAEIEMWMQQESMLDFRIQCACDAWVALSIAAGLQQFAY
jgi:hypothetical protein